MNDFKNIKPLGYIEAAFWGNKDNIIYLSIQSDITNIGEYFFALYTEDEYWIEIKNQKTESIDCTTLSEALIGDKQARICMVSEGQAFFLRNSSLSVAKVCKEEMYDKRSLFGTPIWFDDKGIIPFYQENGLLALTSCKRVEYTFEKQIKNEVLYEREVPNQDGTSLRYISLKCKQVSGSYVGLVKKADVEKNDIYANCLEYCNFERNGNCVSMLFCMKSDSEFHIEDYYIAWRHKDQNYIAPVCKKTGTNKADAIEIQYPEKQIIFLTISYDVERYGEYAGAELINEVEEWEEAKNISLQPESIGMEEGSCIISYQIDTMKSFDHFGSWHINVFTHKEEEKHTLDVEIEDSLMDKELYDGEDTKYKITFKRQNNRFQINRTYGHNALFKKNIQGARALSIDEFLSRPNLSLKGNMYGEYLEGDGRLRVRLYQQMKDVLEAKVVMYHSQGMGVLSTQTIDIKDGIVDEFDIEIPDIDWDNKFLKPVNSIWFRVAIAIKTNEGIYLSALTNYDLNEDISRDRNIYDISKLHLKPIGDQEICGILMSALPYYSGANALSMKYVRPEQLYRSQFTNELLDVRIKKDILIVKMRCRDIEGTYKGVLMEYRKVKEEDAETYLIPYDSLIKQGDSYIMTTKIDMKKYYMRMLYWDIRCAFEKDGNLYTVSCHSNNKKFLRKYKNVFVDRTYPNENSIMFPYATDNNSVALMHREACPQDHWNFRLKEKIAQFLYKTFKSYWDKKNIYLIFEKYCTMAQDNGYFFFKYCMDANVESDFDGEIYYVIDRKAADWEKVVPYRKHVLKYLSLRHMIYLQACKLMISTDTKGHAYVWRSMGSDIKALTYKKQLVFLQHGVTAFKRGHFERGTNVGCESFITTSQFEHDIIHNYLGYPEEEIPITGFARWDVLRDKSEGHREILMMPTWRTWLDDAENEVFAESDYCKNYMALLNNPKLDQILKDYDVTLNFYLHPKFRKFITEFSVVSDHIRLIPFGEAPLNELMMECNLLITDFSSVAWDVYYMNKPVLFYHFDIDDASKTLGFYMDMKNDIFGDRAEKPDELMDLIIEYIESDFAMKEEYAKDREKYFAYVDDNNSQRIWAAIQERQW